MGPAALIIVAVLAVALGVALGRYVWPAGRGVGPALLASAQAEAARLDQECRALRARADQLDADHKVASEEAKRAGQEVARLTERVTGATQQHDEQVKRASAAEGQRDLAASEAKALGAEVAQLTERVVGLTQQCDEQSKRASAAEGQRDLAASEAKALAAEVAQLTERVTSLTQQCDEQSKRAAATEGQRDLAASEVRALGAEAAQLSERVTSLTQQCDEQSRRASEAEGQRDLAATEAKALGAEVAQLTERVASLTQQCEEQFKRATTGEGQRDRALSEVKALAAEVAQLKERESALAQQLEAQAAQLDEQQKQLTAEFENIANRILKANAIELSANSQKELAAILDPLRDRIQDFQKKIETTYNDESREVLSLKAQIGLILETSNAIGSQADGLAKALRGDSQLLGRWGELALERILQAAGLTEGREYISQGRGLGLKSEEGGVQRPDIIVKLPDERTMIVDSKVPLACYERLIAAKDEAERVACGDQFVRDVKGYIDGLAGKRYQENEKLQAHDCVLMFVPIEGALAAALTRDPELFLYGWDRHVVLVGPPTLLMTMRTVASIWRYELQGQNAQEIARLAGELCDKVSMSLIDLNTVAEKITGALNAHNEAVKRLSYGKGNALSVGERIRSLGVKTKRPIPPMLVDGALVTAPVEDSEEDASSEADLATVGSLTRTGL
jgi:DNA recombination protein RmuC